VGERGLPARTIKTTCNVGPPSPTKVSPPSPQGRGLLIQFYPRCPAKGMESSSASSFRRATSRGLPAGHSLRSCGLSKKAERQPLMYHPVCWRGRTIGRQEHQ
jgi:hypothetical protein